MKVVLHEAAASYIVTLVTHPAAEALVLFATQDKSPINYGAARERAKEIVDAINNEIVRQIKNQYVGIMSSLTTETFEIVNKFQPKGTVTFEDRKEQREAEEKRKYTEEEKRDVAAKIESITNRRIAFIQQHLGTVLSSWEKERIKGMVKAEVMAKQDAKMKKTAMSTAAKEAPKQAETPAERLRDLISAFSVRPAAEYTKVEFTPEQREVLDSTIDRVVERRDTTPVPPEAVAKTPKHAVAEGECIHCLKKIYQSKFGLIWYHNHSENKFCRGRGDNLVATPRRNTAFGAMLPR